MHIPDLSDNSLRDLHLLIREAMAEDDKAPEGQKKYGVREYPDWRKQADGFEREMTKRSIEFLPIDWKAKAGS